MLFIKILEIIEVYFVSVRKFCNAFATLKRELEDKV